MTRAAMPSVQAEAETRSAVDLTSPSSQRPAASLSSISRSAVAASGTRNSASASTIKARPSLVESEKACRKSSMPPKPPILARIASISPRARASIRRSAASSRADASMNLTARSSSGGAYGDANGGRAAGMASMPAFYRAPRPSGPGLSAALGQQGLQLVDAAGPARLHALQVADRVVDHGTAAGM